MTDREKQELLSLFSIPANWCQETEARNWEGNSVSYNDPGAVAWDLTGGVCHLFGWDRALEIFPQIERHVTGRKRQAHESNPGIASMVNLQEFNDSTDTSFDLLLLRLQSLPVTSEVVHENAAGVPAAS